MSKQNTQNILMIRPSAFRMNEETAGNNFYQKTLQGSSAEEVIDLALEEFDNMVDTLRLEGVNVYVVEDLPETDTPDALFPNNWISFHFDGKIGLYPMFAKNRRMERREDILIDLEHKEGFQVKEIIDFTEFEDHNVFLEGTGSIVIDHKNRKAYAAISPRTDRAAFGQFCEAFDYDGVVFESLQNVGDQRKQIYHTNVMMCIGSGWATVCLDSVDHPEDRELLESSLINDGLKIVTLSEEQISRFAGNMLEVASTHDETPRIVMSKSAYEALDATQLDTLSHFGKVISIPLDVIEACGGGSARCMMAEIHLPKA
tara:strand:- start:2361 stop:3305 length:945 start_codon:yes stop_codon:yes gene_type:complete